MHDGEWRTRLSHAIQHGNLRAVLADTDPSETDADVVALREALAQIDRSVGADRARLATAFERGGIRARVDRSVADRPLRNLSVTVDRVDATRAVEVVEQLGYVRLAPAEPGPWRAYRTTHGACVLLDRDRGEVRVEVSWPGMRLLRGPVRRFVVPTPSDLATVLLPEPCWFGYIGLHIARLPSRLWRRRSEPDHLGPYLVTPDSLIRPLLEFAGVRPGEMVVDLGCGDGRIPIAAASLGCRARGVESDPELVRRARRAVSAAGLDGRVDIVEGDALGETLDDADLVVMFLPVDTLRRVLPELLDRVRPGARVVVHEQERLTTSVAPDRSTPIATEDGITVAHLWTR